TDLCARRRLSHGLDRVQPRGNRASAPAGGAPAGFVDDASHQSRSGWHAAPHRRCVSVNADQVRVSADVRVSPWISDEPLAQRIIWRVRYRSRAWCILRRLLLGNNVASICGWGDEPDCHCGIDGICRIRKTGAVRNAPGADQRRAFDNGRMLDDRALNDRGNNGSIRVFQVRLLKCLTQTSVVLWQSFLAGTSLEVGSTPAIASFLVPLLLSSP